MTMPLSEKYGTKLDPRDKAAIDHWLANPGDSVFDAVIKGYPDAKKGGAPRRFKRITTKPEALLYIEARRRELSIESNLHMSQALVELTAMAFSNVYDYIEVDEDGEKITLKAKEELSLLQQRCAKEITASTVTTESADGGSQTRTKVTVKIWDKQKAINDLARMLGWKGAEGDGLPEHVKKIMEIGVLILPPDKTPEQAIAGYVPYDGQVIDAETN